MRTLQTSITLIDKIFIFILGCFSLLIPAAFIINKTFSEDVGILLITTPTQELVYSMDKAQIIKIKGRVGITEIEIKNNKFRFLNSECPTKQCLKSGWFSLPMIPQVCLPNGISAVIKKKSSKTVEVDGVAM